MVEEFQESESAFRLNYEGRRRELIESIIEEFGIYIGDLNVEQLELVQTFTSALCTFIEALIATREEE
jgi:hypothetical protein